MILAVLLGATVYMEMMLSKINRDVDDTTMSAEEYEEYLAQQNELENSVPSGTIVDPEDITWGPDSELLKNDDKINILLIGQDRRPGEGRSRSDAMILCTIHKDTGSLTLTSFMRDMYVQIPGYRDDRINACYPLGGMKLLDQCLASNFGIQVDGNIEVDFFGFSGIVDLMGGVEIDLTQAEARHLNGEHNWSLREGKNRLTGEQALHYARIRKIGNDFERTSRQRKVISALVDGCRSMSVPQLHNLLMEILPLVTTDLTNQKILGLVRDLAPLLPKLSMDSQRIPGDGMYQNASIRGMSVLLPDIKANRELLKDTIG